MSDSVPMPRIDTEIDPPIGRLLIDNPARRNAVTLAMWQAIPQSVAALEADPEVRVIILGGTGSLAFVSGADISEFETVRRDAVSARAYEAANASAFAAVRAARKPTIAVIRGFCLGGGFGLAVACDLRLAADDAVFGIPAARLGVGYPPDAMRDVIAVLGAARAKELIFTARRIAAAEAAAIGLARVVPTADLDVEADALARLISANAPLTIRAAKAAIDAASGGDGGWDQARSLADACFDSEDFAEGRTAFLQKRAPTFSGS